MTCQDDLGGGSEEGGTLSTCMRMRGVVVHAMAVNVSRRVLAHGVCFSDVNAGAAVPNGVPHDCSCLLQMAPTISALSNTNKLTNPIHSSGSALSGSYLYGPQLFIIDYSSCA